MAQAQAKKQVRRKTTRNKTTATRKPRAAGARSRTVVKRAAKAANARSSVEAISHLSRGIREIAAITLLVASVLFLLALGSFEITDPGWSQTGTTASVKNTGGIAGAWFADVAFYLYGYIAFLLPLMMAFLGWLMFYEVRPENINSAPYIFVRITGFLIMISMACGLADLHFNVSEGSLPLGVDGGGLAGTVLASKFIEVTSPLGSTLIMLGLFLGSFSLATRISWLSVTEIVGGALLHIIDSLTYRLEGIWDSYRDHNAELSARRNESFQARQDKRQELQRQRKTEREQKIQQRQEKQKNEIVIPTPIEKMKELKKIPTVSSVVAKVAGTNKNVKKVESIKKTNNEKQFKLFDSNVDTELPPLSLLDEPQPQSIGFSEDELETLSRLLEDRLADFKVIAEVVAVQPGPVITRFELDLAPGTKASKISGLSRDIARSLSLVSVRVVEVIRGRSTIGLEIPNDQREIVMLSEILRSKKYSDSKSPLTMALGKGIGGQAIVADLAKMPHLLVAGTTGSGKSVGVNTMLTSLLYKASPEQVRLILIDPKMLELNVYEDIPHLLAPVVTDMKEASNALRWCVGEMERRYKLMAALGVRNIGGFNKKVELAIKENNAIEDPLYKKDEAFDPEAPAPTLESLPYIVVVVDEFADMIMVVGKKVEELIARIAQKARAAGIHLILATQRPSTDVITGLIKSNIPTRMAFQVSTKLDSRIILDQGGAESLLGHGDMLYLPPGTAQAERVHGAFIDDHEVHNVVGYLKQQGTANYIGEILDEPSVPIPGLSGEPAGDEGGERDALYDQAVVIVTETRKASISYVQRRLKIGYNRAARMVEEMEEAGVISPVQSNGQREVIAPPPVS